MSLSLFFVVLLGYHAQATPDFRIIRGTTAPDGIAPYQVSLSYNDKHICGGSIINKRWVVTAAHCFDHGELSNFKIRMGSNLRNSGGVVVEIKDVIIHELYETHTVKNDIALINVDTDITFSDKIQPIELTAEDTPEGLGVLATGWGKTEKGYAPTELQMLTLQTTNNIYCHSEFLNINMDVTTTNLCTITAKGQGMCRGDSGGPLVFNNQLVGITSFGEPCALGYPDVFTRVYSYVDWIERNIAANESDLI